MKVLLAEDNTRLVDTLVQGLAEATIAAAAALRAGGTFVASSARRFVPDAPTPTPMTKNETKAAIRPATSEVCIHAVAAAAVVPPRASVTMPPKIHGVRLPPISAPCPQRGRDSCTP